MSDAGFASRVRQAPAEALARMHVAADELINASADAQELPGLAREAARGGRGPGGLLSDPRDAEDEIRTILARISRARQELQACIDCQMEGQV